MSNTATPADISIDPLRLQELIKFQGEEIFKLKNHLKYAQSQNEELKMRIASLVDVAVKQPQITAVSPSSLPVPNSLIPPSTDSYMIRADGNSQSGILQLLRRMLSRPILTAYQDSFTWNKYPDQGTIYRPARQIALDGSIEPARSSPPNKPNELVACFSGNWYYVGIYETSVPELLTQSAYQALPSQIQQAVLKAPVGKNINMREKVSMYDDGSLAVMRVDFRRVGYNPGIQAMLASLSPTSISPTIGNLTSPTEPYKICSAQGPSFTEIIKAMRTMLSHNVLLVWDESVAWDQYPTRGTLYLPAQHSTGGGNTIPANNKHAKKPNELFVRISGQFYYLGTYDAAASEVLDEYGFDALPANIQTAVMKAKSGKKMPRKEKEEMYRRGTFSAKRMDLRRNGYNQGIPTMLDAITSSLSPGINGDVADVANASD